MRKIYKIVVFLVAVGLVLLCAQRVVMPKYITQGQDGRLVAEYYASAKNHDVVFIGDCEVYESICPVTLWQEYGISSYVRGSPQQLIWHSCHLMAETLEYETPKVFVFNVLSMKYGTPQNEAYNRMALDGMRWSRHKIAAIQAAMTEEETFASYVFPLLRFHGRWSELKPEDWTYAFRQPPNVSVNGYLLQTGVDGIENLRAGRPLADYTLPEICWAYLDKMRILCEENGVELILMKAPTGTSAWWWYDQWDTAVAEYAQSHSLAYYNFLHDVEKIGIDFTTDTYDKGGHLNLSGAEKLSRYFGEILARDHGITGHKGDAVYEEIWAAVTADYQQKRRNKT